MARRSSRRKLRQNEPLSTYDLILAEAMRLIARDGVEEMKIKDIADAVGIQIPSIYKHFVNRDAIVATLARTMVEELAQFLKPELDLPPDVWMRNWAKGLVLFYATRPAYARMLLRDLATPTGYPVLTKALGPVGTTPDIEPIKQLSAHFDAAYAKGVKAGVFKRLDRSLFFSTMFGLVVVSITWPYSASARQFGAAQIEKLQGIAMSTALHLAAGGNV
jgi:AcrR family transcriptional regulator